MKVMTQEKSERGITLVALVVMIIVLLILAGVSISTVLGDNGIIKQSKNMKENQLIKIQEEKEKENKLMQKLNTTPELPEKKEWELSSVAKVGDMVEYPCRAGFEEWTIFYNKNREIRLIPLDIFTTSQDTPITITGIDGYANYEKTIEANLQDYDNQDYVSDVRILEYSTTHTANTTDDTKENGDETAVQIDDITPLIESGIIWVYKEEIPIFLNSKYILPVMEGEGYVRCLIGGKTILGKKVYYSDPGTITNYTVNGNIMPVVVLKQGILTSGKNSEEKWVLIP